ncbi:MAG: carbohydrate-binding protein, partial [Armatimonadetes bacterium]|nr:carbohydrate-binding protein [Armatimonadota bacterium]
GFRFGHDFAAPSPRPAWPPVASHSIGLAACRAASDGVRITSKAIENLHDGDCFVAPASPRGAAWRTATMSFASGQSSINTDRAGRTPPRHRNATDPLVLEVDRRDGASPGIGSQWTFIHNVQADTWVRFDRVPLGRGYLRFRAVYGKVTDAPAEVEVRLDAPDGPVVARCALRRTDRPRTGWVQIYGEATGDVSTEATGTRDVFLRFRSSDAARPVGEFEYFRFERYRGDIALAPNEVKIEVRAGDRSGTKLGEFYPRFTGSPDTFRTLVASLEPVPPGQPLCFVVPSALQGPIGRIASVGLIRATGTGPGRDVGIAPRRDRRGRIVLPAPSHWPRYQPPPTAPGAQIPSKGLAVWLDAASMPTVEREADGSVSVWRDRSGRGNDATQSDAGHRPSYHAAALNGKPALRFTEKRSTRLELRDLSSARINATAFAVVSNPEAGDPLNHDARVFTASDGSEFDYQGGIALGIPGTATGGPRVIHGTFENRAARFVRVGCFSPIYQTYFSGLVSEIIVYDRLLTPDETEMVRAYLMSKWKLAE